MLQNYEQQLIKRGQARIRELLAQNGVCLSAKEFLAVETFVGCYVQSFLELQLRFLGGDVEVVDYPTLILIFGLKQMVGQPG